MSDSAQIEPIFGATFLAWWPWLRLVFPQQLCQYSRRSRPLLEQKQARKEVVIRNRTLCHLGEGKWYFKDIYAKLENVMWKISKLFSKKMWKYEIKSIYSTAVNVWSWATCLGCHDFLAEFQFVFKDTSYKLRNLPSINCLYLLSAIVSIFPKIQSPWREAG